MSMARVRRAAAAVAALPVLALVAASPASASAPALTPTALVRHVALHNSDFHNGTTVRLFQGGNRVRGQVTLDNCGFNFTTETRRVARHQVGIFRRNASVAFGSNEVVAYSSRHFARLALTQYRRSVTQCPNGVFIPSGLAGVPDVRYHSSTVHRSATLPVCDNAVVRQEVEFRGDPKHSFFVLIFQRRGTVLNGVYGFYGSRRP